MIMKPNDLEGANGAPKKNDIHVRFPENVSAVSPDQLANVERIAAYLKSHPEASCIIKGYASPDGNYDDNIMLANGRAESVMDLLINTFGIEAERIEAMGQGIHNAIDELEGRVSICEIIVK